MKKCFLSILIVCILVCTSYGIICSAESIYPSYTYTRTDNGQLFTDIAVGDNSSVIVGQNGRMYIYENGICEYIEPGMFEDFVQVEYTGNEFIAMSDAVVIKSNDGRKWDIISVDNDFLPEGIFICTKDKTIVEKTDGIYETIDFVTYDKISSSGSKTNKYAANFQTPNFSVENNSFTEIKNYYYMIFGENDSLDSITFDKKLPLFINLSGIQSGDLPVKIDKIEFVEMNEASLIIYYVKDFKLIKAETYDFDTWIETYINLPEQNTYLSSVIMGKLNNEFLFAYDTNDSVGIYKTRKIVRTIDLNTFNNIATTDVRGDIIAANDEIFILTSSSVYEILDGTIKAIVKEETILGDKESIITTDNADFMWKREDGINLYWNRFGEWEIAPTDSFITSHYINGNANYQIIWTGSTYIIRPTDYDNGYNPTGASGNIEIYDEGFNYIKSVALNNYILQMSYVDEKCYVLTNSNEVFSSSDFENWIKEGETELPLSNGTTKIYKTLTKATSGYDYIHDVKSVINKNVKKEVLYENWKGNKVDLNSGMYIRFDENTASFSKDGVYWKDITLPLGVDKIQKARIEGGKLIITTPEVELSYSIDTESVNSLRTYVEIEGKILGFDVEPIIESDRTLVPLRFIFETLGAEVDWENSTRTAIVQNDEATILFSIDNTTASVNSVTKSMDVPARLVNDKTMVPLRFLSEELGFNVVWDEVTRTATISK